MLHDVRVAEDAEQVSHYTHEASNSNQGSILGGEMTMNVGLTSTTLVAEGRSRRHRAVRGYVQVHEIHVVREIGNNIGDGAIGAEGVGIDSSDTLRCVRVFFFCF